MQLAGGLHIEVQEPGQRQIDLADLLHVQGIAEAAQTDNVLFVQGLFHLGCEPGPGLPVQLNERGDTLAVRFIALQSHFRDSAPRAAESEMRWPPLLRRRTGRLAARPDVQFRSPAAADKLGAMCGIVGYVGHSTGRGNAGHSALDVVLEGLRRLEYRGYDSAGVAVVADGAISSRKKSGKLSNLLAELEEQPAAGDRHRHRPHPLGHARRPHGPERAPAPGRRRQAGPDPQRHHRELRRAQARTAGQGRRRSRPRRTPRWPPCCWATSSGTKLGGDTVQRRPDQGHAARLPAPRGRLHPAGRARGPARRRRRRPPQLAAGGWPGRGRELPGLGRLRLHRLHPPRGGTGPGPDRHHHRGHRGDHRLLRRPGRGQGIPRGLGPGIGRKGRLPVLHGEGNPRPARRRGARPCWAARTSTAS